MLGGLLTEIVWRDGSGRDWKPHELEKSHLANIIYHITNLSGKYSRAMFEAMVVEAVRRGITDDYLAKAPYPYIDNLTGVNMIAEYSNGRMIPKPYEIDHLVLRVGSLVIGISLDPTVFGDPVWKNDLPKTTKEVKYDANDIIPWTHDVGEAIMTYWMHAFEHLALSGAQHHLSGDELLRCEWRQNNYVLIKITQKNSFDITHLIVQKGDLTLYDPEEV